MAERERGVRLAPYTTLRVGGEARAFVTARDAGELAALVGEADRAGEPVLVLGGGSNLLISDEGFDGLVVKVASRGVSVAEVDGRVEVTAEAGEDWDALVQRAVAEGWSGVECLSGIPGLVGSTPIQNVGAYGQEVAQTVTGVRVYDRRAREIRDLGPADCGFAYRDSVFKRDPARYVVLAVTYSLERADLSGPVAYQELATRLGVELGARAGLHDVRDAVIGLRRGKGMVLDPADPDTCSAGSFFTNPVLSAAEAAELERRSPGFPRWAMPGDHVKVPAGWLIEHAGFPKGYRRGPARISTKHTLALTNPGGLHVTGFPTDPEALVSGAPPVPDAEPAATAADLLELAREIRQGVEAKFGVTLVNEPVLAGVTL
ncbi:UDP-N-acetylmuramate dehydrogenase [Sphaerisporangium sp. B11E5]|uniref:UDP-N-acetylmuramate dehydrogenase n=1 Tax=Sphaerisporangium sp. B11E5 TaxID=3153563 RepID=UPI00325D43C0